MYESAEHCDDMLLLELIDDQLKPYGLEIVHVANVGGTYCWHIKVAGPETHAPPGRFMDWNEDTLEITTSCRNRGRSSNPVCHGLGTQAH